MRQFIAPSEPDARGIITVTGKKFRYLRNVLRLQVEDILDVRLNDGDLCKMRVIEIKDFCNVLLLERCAGADALMPSATETGVSAGIVNTCIADSCAPLWLFQFMPKPQKMDLIVRQATEAGVSVIVPVKSSRSQKSDCIERMDRWHRIIHEARQQSGSPVGTIIYEPLDVNEAIRLWQAHRGIQPCAAVLYEEPEGCVPLHLCVKEKCGSGGMYTAAAVTVGCEGGIAPDELAALRNSGFEPVHFNTNILRTETAAIYGIAAMQTILTEYTSWQQSGSNC